MKKVVFTVVGLLSISAAAAVIAILRRSAMIQRDGHSEPSKVYSGDAGHISRGRHTIVRRRIHDIGDMAME